MSANIRDKFDQTECVEINEIIIHLWGSDEILKLGWLVDEV